MAGRRRGRQGRGPDPFGEVEETRKKRSGGAAEDGEVEVEGSGGGSGDVVQGGGIGVDPPIQSGGRKGGKRGGDGSSAAPATGAVVEVASGA